MRFEGLMALLTDTTAENVFDRFDEKIDDPYDRCEGVSQSLGACPFKKINNSNFCARHGGNSRLDAVKAEKVRNYRLRKWQSRVTEFADNEQIKSLREEVGILRMILEEMLGQCQDSTDLMLYSARMSSLVLNIEKLVVSCDKLENRMGLLLNKSSILQLAGQFIETINITLTAPEFANGKVSDVSANIMESISNKLIEATMAASNPIAE